MNRVIVSFIIPVYNVEQYLRRCVESISSQKYRDIEIILVDDGSPDGSPKLCDLLSSQDPRIHVLHKENGGLSDARNAGLSLATGDYIVFIDGDDFWLSTDGLNALMAIVERHQEVDFVGFNCKYYYPFSEEYTPWVRYDSILAEPVDKNMAITTLVRSGTFPMSACLKIMKRSFLINNGLFFKKGLIAEDIPWFINVLEKTSQCCFVNEYIYSYRQNVLGSISNISDYRSFNSLFSIFKSELSFVDERSFNNDARVAIKSFLAYEYCILLTYLSGFNKSERKKIREELYEYRSILCFRDNPKVRVVALLDSVLGIRITEEVLALYQYYRKKKR